MDRFIDYNEDGWYVSFSILKSNMDRFIVEQFKQRLEYFLNFKIQYG